MLLPDQTVIITEFSCVLYTLIMCKSESSVSLQDELTLMPLSCREVRRLLHAQSTMSVMVGHIWESMETIQSSIPMG
jgi:hypothetical protein